MYGGLAQDGSLRAVKMEKDERRAILEQIGTNSLKTLLGSEHTRYTKALRQLLLAPVT